MLHGLRNWASSKYSAVLIALLVISFAIWGIGDFTNMGNTDVATGKDITISQEAFLKEFDRTRRQTELQQRRSISIADARAFGMDQQVIQSLVRDELFRHYLKTAGFSASPGMVAKLIFENPDFADEQGKFSQELFDQILFRNGFTEQEAQTLFFTIMMENQYAQTLIKLGKASPAINIGLTQTSNISVRLKMIEVDIPEQEISNNDALEFFNKNQDLYKIPQQHQFEILNIDQDALRSTLRGAIKDEDVQTYYEQNKDSFRTEERRNFIQFRNKSNLPKDEFVSRVNAYQNDNDDSDIAVIRFEGKTKASLLDEMANIVFDLDAGAISEPSSELMGEVIYKVEKIIPGTIPPLADIKSLVLDTMVSNQLSEAINDLYIAVEDRLAAGETFQGMTETKGLTIKQETISKNALATVLQLPDRQTLDDILNLQPGDEPYGFNNRNLVPSFIKLLNIEDERPAQFDEVQEQVKSDALVEKNIQTRDLSISSAREDFGNAMDKTLTRQQLTELLQGQDLSPILLRDDIHAFIISDQKAIVAQKVELISSDQKPDPRLNPLILNELIVELQSDVLGQLVDSGDLKTYPANIEGALSRFN